MNLHEAANYGLIPTYDEFKSGMLKLIEQGKISREDAALVLPELKESEDERMRKELYEFIKVNSPTEDANRFIAWLEKQEEPEPGDEDRYMEGYMNGMNDAIKRAKPAEVAPNQFDGITYGMQGYSTEKSAGWSEEDERNLNIIIRAIHGAGNITPIDGELAEKWLKSLRPQPHWKPSEEQPEVDLEKEIQEHIKECLDVKFPTTDIELIKKDVAYTARKFYELGKNSK